MSTMGVKQGSPLLNTPFGQCTEKLEDLIQEALQEHEVTPAIG
mgnify:FL=1